MPVSHYALILTSVIAAGGLTVALLSGQVAAAALPALVAAAATRRGQWRR